MSKRSGSVLFQVKGSDVHACCFTGYSACYCVLPLFLLNKNKQLEQLILKKGLELWDMKHCSSSRLLQRVQGRIYYISSITNTL